MRVLALPLLMALVSGCAAPPVAPGAAAPSEVARADTLTVLYVPAEGFAYTGADGRLTGVTAELMRAFAAWEARETGRPIVLDFVEEPDWRAFYARVRDAEGTVFGLGNVTITEARRAELRFSPPYLHNVAVLVTRDDVPELAHLDEIPERFAGLRGVPFAGTLHEVRLRRLREAYLPEAPLEPATSNAEILARVAEGGRFAYVDGYNFWRAEAAGAPLRRHAVADDPGETFGVIMPLGNPLAPRLDAFLAGTAGTAGFVASPAYGALLQRHLGPALAAQLERARREAEAP